MREVVRLALVEMAVLVALVAYLVWKSPSPFDGARSQIEYVGARQAVTVYMPPRLLARYVFNAQRVGWYCRKLGPSLYDGEWWECFAPEVLERARARVTTSL